MFRYLIIVLLLGLNAAGCQEPDPAPVPTTAAPAPVTSVYVTTSGKCYHLDGCSSLRKNKRSVTLEEAVLQGYAPCKICNSPASANQ